MRSIQTKQKTSRSSPLLEWQTCDSDAEWKTPSQDALTTTVLHLEDISRPSWVARHWRIGAALLMILATIGGWTWSVAQRGLNQIEAELRDSVELDLWATDTQDEGLRPASEQEIHKVSISAQGDTARPLTNTVQLLALPAETAIIQIVAQAGPDQPALRQTRFYRQTAEGWLRTKPDAELWGSPRRLESAHFIIHFRQNDAQVVNLVAAQIDDLYSELQRNFDLTPNATKLVIEVSVEQVTGAILTPQWAYESLVVPSPAIYFAPVELNDSAILAQSIALPLIKYMGGRAIEEHAIPQRWQPLLHGLQLWQLWNLDMPLAHWQQELVKWLYIDAPLATVAQQSVLPASYTELCVMHRLWMLSPMVVGVPLECTVWDTLSWSPIASATYVQRTRLDQLRMPLADWAIPYYSEANDPYHSSEVVAVATLIEYAVAVYGYEQLPVMLAGLAHYNDWETLAQAVFGVSASDFEAGWQRYLAQQYNVSLGN